jgi:hypothetical protein
MIVTENGEEFKVDIQEIEKKVFAMCMAEGRAIMADLLAEADEQLFANRNVKEYKSEGLRKTSLKTLMGEVEYSRRVYWTLDESGGKEYVYLLDEALGNNAPGKMSELVSTVIATAACESDYREVANKVSEMSGLKISHTTAWSVTQAVGARVRDREEELAGKAKKAEGVGQIESKVLFEEQDGIWLNLQGKDRNEHGKSKEMKVAIAYDGITETAGGRRRLSDKVACASFDHVTEFVERKEGVIASVYNVDEIEMRVLNGDGAKWISCQKGADTVYQLDPFHRNKAIREYVNDPELCGIMLKLLLNREIDDLLDVIDASINSTDDAYEQTKRKALYDYFNNNKDALTPYHSRGVKIPAVNPGLMPAQCGAMESNVFTMVGNRMKGGRANWSIKGANHLAALLCLKQTGRLKQTLSVMGEKMKSALVPGTAGFSAAKSLQKVGSGYNGFKHAAIPNMAWSKGLLGMKALSRLRFNY